MKLKMVLWVSLALFISSCSLAEDVTPPPVLATAQAAPRQQVATPVHPAAQATSGGLVELSPPETAPSILSGAAIFAESCEPCHGAQGLGAGSMSSNLEVEPPPLGKLDFARTARPLDWYGVVTEGRMDRFMPPFRSLSDGQRWDVVAYALSLGYPPETSLRGASLYDETCAGCHGEAGQGAENAPPLNTSEIFAGYALDELLVTIQDGKGSMPAYADILPQEDQLLVAAYVQSLGTVAHADNRATVDQPPVVEGSTAEKFSGVIQGEVFNGTAGEGLPEALNVTVVGLEGDTPVFEQDVPVDQAGKYALEGLEVQPGRIYGAMVEYQDVMYFTVGGHFIEETPILDLPLVIFETTADESKLVAERLHFIFDFSIEGFVEISELWLLSTEGDRTLVQPGGVNAIPIRLPEGFSNLRFADAVSPDQYTLTEEGLIVHEPVRPGEPLEVVFSFTLPYQRSLEFTQPIDFPVQAVVLLTESDAPELRGEGLQDLGERDMGGFVLHSYSMERLEAGEQLDLTLQGSTPLTQQGGSSTSNLAIGLAVFGVVLVVVGVVWWSWRRRAGEQDLALPGEEEPELSRAQLLRAIASLDDALENGEIEEQVYQERRALLKAQLLEQMQADDD